MVFELWISRENAWTFNNCTVAQSPLERLPALISQRKSPLKPGACVHLSAAASQRVTFSAALIPCICNKRVRPVARVAWQRPNSRAAEWAGSETKTIFFACAIIINNETARAALNISCLRAACKHTTQTTRAQQQQQLSHFRRALWIIYCRLLWWSSRRKSIALFLLQCDLRPAAPFAVDLSFSALPKCRSRGKFLWAT